MRINPLPFVLTPGIATVGYLLGNAVGAAVALGGWLAVVCSATVLVIARHARQARLDQPDY